MKNVDVEASLSTTPPSWKHVETHPGHPLSSVRVQVHTDSQSKAKRTGNFNYKFEEHGMPGTGGQECYLPSHLLHLLTGAPHTHKWTEQRHDRPGTIIPSTRVPEGPSHCPVTAGANQKHTTSSTSTSVLRIKEELLK